MPQGPPPPPPRSLPLPHLLPLPLAPSNIFDFDSLDLVLLEDAAGVTREADPNNADAFHLGTPGAYNSDLMSFFDSTMLGAFGDDTLMSLDPNATTTAAAAVTAAVTQPSGAAAPEAPEAHEAPGYQGPHEAHDGGSNGGESNNDEGMEESIARAENQFNTAANNVPGAGPLPPASFAQGTSASTNTLTDFTKRRNWPAKVVEELKDLLQILDANGRIKYVSANIASLVGYAPEELQDVFLRDLIHPDDQGVFVAELNESIASGNTLRLFYRFKKKDGAWIVFEAIGHAHIAAARFAPNPSNQSPFCQAVFMMARLYPTRNASLLDSFLEHKIENERLKRRIAELRREEEAEADEAYKQWRHSQEGRSDITPSEDTGGASFPRGGGSSEGAMTSADLLPLSTALTRENLEGAAAGSRPDSLRDKMARYEGTSHADTIEMLTGLRYQEGERSRGITTGNASPRLVRGDAGIAIPLERDTRPGDKKKKLKTAEEYVCTDCGTLDSPEWRKGPSGPKTLCNACGLRWAKKEKKRNHPSTSNHRGPMPDTAALS